VCLRRGVSGPGEGVDIAALPSADLRDDVRPIRFPSPASLSERQPISPAHNSGAAATGSSKPSSGKA
jgi:hypothetical protein